MPLAVFLASQDHKLLRYAPALLASGIAARATPLMPITSVISDVKDSSWLGFLTLGTFRRCYLFLALILLAVPKRRKRSG